MSVKKLTEIQRESNRIISRDIAGDYVPFPSQSSSCLGYIHSKWKNRADYFWDILLGKQDIEGEPLRSGGGQGITYAVNRGKSPMYIKLYKPGRLSRRLRDLMGSYRWRREFEAHLQAEKKGIRCSQIVAALSYGPLYSMNHLVATLQVPGREVAKILRESSNPEEKEHTLELLAKKVKEFHRLGFWHAHLHAKHMFVTSSDEIYVIDLERSAFYDTLPDKKRDRNLKQITKSLRNVAGEDAANRFLDIYRQS